MFIIRVKQSHISIHFVKSVRACTTEVLQKQSPEIGKLPVTRLSDSFFFLHIIFMYVIGCILKEPEIINLWLKPHYFSETKISRRQTLYQYVESMYQEELNYLIVYTEFILVRLRRKL